MEKEEKKADFRVGFNGGFWLFIGMLIGGVIAIIVHNTIPEKDTTDKWVGKEVYCDRVAGNNWRGIVGAVEGKYIYLDDAERQCWIGCNCGDNDSYVCDNTSKYKYMERYPLEDEYYKVQAKSDCYIPGDIESIINYKNRKI